ncbi:GGDEF domain-containing protein [Thiotrichales bacterium 19S11-10]|nr:GGDEF domain-containing protein [Thiotrichales bacterium 19S11-10]
MVDAFNLWLVTNNQSIVQCVSQFVPEYQIKTLEEHQVSQISRSSDQPDVILIDSNSVRSDPDYLLSNDFSELPPIIYLHREIEEHLPNRKLKKLIYDKINLDKVTQTGFKRALLNITEKYQTLMELDKQVKLLKQLTNHFDRDNPEDNDEVSSIKNLISENQYLIKKVIQQNEILKNLARNDALTNIPNRRSYEETLLSLLSHAKRHDHILAILLIDLDKFKYINDTFGHHVGDILLQNVATRLKECLRKGDFVARTGGDEFVVILHEIDNKDIAGVVAYKILSELTKSFTIEEHTIDIGASIGISCYPENGSSMDALVKSADKAMYQAKKSDELKYVFAPKMPHKNHA